MKKLFLSLALLLAMPAHAAQPEGRIAQATESAKQTFHQAKRAALKQLDESMDRFRRCIKGNCTKMEALKAARDVTIATAGVITAMYVTGRVLEKGSGLAYRYTPKKMRPVLRVTSQAGQALQAPGKGMVSLISPSPKYKTGQMVRFNDLYGQSSGRIVEYYPQDDTYWVEIKWSDTHFEYNRIKSNKVIGKVESKLNS